MRSRGAPVSYSTEPQMKKRYLPYEYGERRWFFGAMFRWPHFRCPRMAGSGCPRGPEGSGPQASPLYQRLVNKR